MIDPPTLTNAPRPHAAMLFPPMSNRTPNFTLEQKLYLLQQMQGVVDTVQDFRKDTNTTVQRNAVWERLAQSFNAAFPHRPPSSTGSLKTLWKRLKVECRTALYKRQEQLAAGLPLAALTQVQREVTALVPNLISHQDELDGDAGYGAGRTASPITVAGTTGTSGSDQEEDEDSKEQVAINLGLATPGDQRDMHARPHPSTSSGPRPPALFYPGQSATAPRQPGEARAELRGVARVCERSPWPEPDGAGRLLALQERVWEAKRRAARQKEKAARAKKHYYRAKLKRLGTEGTEVTLSSSDSSD
ncbi:fibrinogen silencer-binding protein isoform X3 [Denticeps clupeoides]|uniref:fibrinogen silencer-binding protein isoform X3 n=1 Tax=Denticeps clupeoides TaxID=299321 RepID=UPI0010A2BEDA|nr:fibrinogen silencer-binding protein-like isoform X3 [Denticeps clupeoides]